MPDPDIFEEKKETNPNDLFKDQLGSITNEAGEPKYESVEEALKALRHSQEHIAKLEAEAAQREQEKSTLSEELAKKATVEDFVERLTKAQQDGEKPNSEVTPAPEGLTKEAVVDLINSVQQEQQSVAKKQENVNQVVKALTDKFGEKAQETLAAKANELGLTIGQVKSMSETTPKVVLSFFEKGTDSTSPTVTSSFVTPLKPKEPENSPPKPEKSMLEGATSGQLKDYWNKVKEYTYKDLGVET